jgi:hypothetical protein
MLPIYQQLALCKTRIASIKQGENTENLPLALADRLAYLTLEEQRLTALWEKKSPKAKEICKLKQAIADYRPYKTYKLPPRPLDPDYPRLERARAYAERAAGLLDPRSLARARTQLHEAQRAVARQEADLSRWIALYQNNDARRQANTSADAAHRANLDRLAELTASHLAPPVRRKRATAHAQQWPLPASLRERYGYDHHTGAIDRRSTKRSFLLRSLTQRVMLSGVRVPAAYLLCALLDLPWAPAKHKLVSTAPTGEPFPFAKQFLTLRPRA